MSVVLSGSQTRTTDDPHACRKRMTACRSGNIRRRNGVYSLHIREDGPRPTAGLAARQQLCKKFSPCCVSRESKVETTMRRLQLGSGVVLLIYLFLHLANHALGIWSLELAGRGLALALRLWHSVPGTILLYGSASLHFALALRTVYGRHHWTLPATEWIRLWAGLSLPLLLIRHA